MTRGNRENLDNEHMRCLNELSKKDALLLNIPEEMKRAKALLDQKERAWAEERQAHAERHRDEVDRMVKTHGEHVENIEKQHNFWLRKKEEETASFVQEFDNYRERTMKETKRYKEELA